MRINVYSQELTPEVVSLKKVSNTGCVYKAAQLILHSSDHLHHSPEDDDRSAVMFWLPRSQHRREEMAKAFERIATIFRGEPDYTLAGVPDGGMKVVTNTHMAEPDEVVGERMEKELRDWERKIATTPPEVIAMTPKHDVVSEVLAELDRATAKFPTWPDDPLHAVAVVNEEVGELNKAVLQQVYEPQKNPLNAVHDEAVQAAAMLLRFIASIDQYKSNMAHQHVQKEPKP